MVVVCLIFEIILSKCFLPLCVYLLLKFAIQNVYCGNILKYEWYANDILFYVCNVKCLFKWFI